MNEGKKPTFFGRKTFVGKKLPNLKLAHFSLIPRRGGGGGESAWYTLFAHARNYSKSHMVELGACTNITINSSHEQHKPS